MRTSSTRRYYRPAFEFQRGGPHIRGSAAHKPDLSIAINRPSLQIQQQQQQIILPNTNSHSIRTPKSSRQKLPVTLDMFTIADDCGSLSFKDVKSLNLSSRKLNNVDIDSLKDLISLVKLDVSDNNLKLEPFSCLEKLEDLDFSCNNLTTFSYDSIQNKKDAFSSLRKLNLNYNSIGKSLEYFTNFPNLTVLLLTHNNLTALPKNSNLFYKLEYLDLSYNSLNTDSCFIALAALPNLKTLILDNNNVISIPKFQFGFEKMTSISLKNNKIESSIDIISLADLDCLNEVNILNNPVNIYRKDIQLLQSAYSTSHIKLICSEEPPEKKRAPRKFMNIVRVDDDPLLLPNKELQKRFFPNKKDNNENQQDSIQKSDNELTGNEEDFNDDKYEGKKQSQNDADEFDEFGQKKSTQQKVDTDVFMTDFGLIPPTPLPPPSDGEQQDGSDAEIRNIWKEIPVIKEENRKLFTSNSSVEKFNDAFKKLKFIVEHPSIPISTSASGSQTKARINRLQKSASNTNSMNNISFDDNQPSFLPNEDNLPEFNVSSPRYPRPRPNSTRVPYESISATTSNQNLNNSANGTLKVPPLNFDGKNNSNNTIRQRRSARANAPTTARKKKKTEGNDEIDIEEKLNSNQQLSKVDVMKILQQMENKLSSAEDIINQEDQDGMNPVDKALDQTNFSTLHKQYESIRSEIVSTLRV